MCQCLLDLDLCERRLEIVRSPKDAAGEPNYSPYGNRIAVVLVGGIELSTRVIHSCNSLCPLQVLAVIMSDQHRPASFLQRLYYVPWVTRMISWLIDAAARRQV
jgi:hypothetical protein